MITPPTQHATEPKEQFIARHAQYVDALRADVETASIAAREASQRYVAAQRQGMSLQLVATLREGSFLAARALGRARSRLAAGELELVLLRR